MQHVPLKDRLGVCTRVCCSFHAAAVAATNSISMSMSSQPECDHLAEWLQRHGAGITALRCQYKPVHTCTYPYVQPSLASLPGLQVRDLDLCELSLQSGFFTACSNLIRLLLSNCRMEMMPSATSGAFSNPLMQLSVLISLQHLKLDTVGAVPSEEHPQDSPLLELPGKLLSHLVQLTYLQVAGDQVQSDAALQHLSTVSALQHLEFTSDIWPLQHLTPAALTGLQHLQHLTALRLHHVPWDVNLHNIPAVTVLTALRVLQLWDSPSVDPAVLAGFSGLQEVDLECTEPWEAERSTALLAAIGQQAQLRRLVLNPCSFWYPPSAAACSALTASSYLQHMKRVPCELPACAWRQMFPPGRCLPELTHLVIPTRTRRAQQLSHEELQAMVSCCPALAHLNVGGQLAFSTAAPLQQLTGLTNLSMRAPFQDTAASIARLTGLQRLLLDAHQAGDRVTVSGLLQLTVLQQLWSFCAGGASCDPRLDSQASRTGSVCIIKAPAGAPPDVWLQLKGRCEVAQLQVD